MIQHSSVLLSIRSEYTRLIVRGQKTIEIRKTRPHLATPFKCYIYQCLPRWGDWNDSDGHVIGEFICNHIYENIVCGKISETNYLCLSTESDYCRKHACLSEEQLYNYCNGRLVFGWNISDLKIYAEPKQISELWSFTRPPQSWRYVQETT